ncbi:hypothetical protein Y032_0203g1830 [Ancylostoma ceylanicum]|uniref:Uncharacterized protein n=1 Tax=Ancylostoma ceylanicum TaxID=53326 RepID=A0A016SMX8_9BILA|nr:hypothetical protein Y032_0203g1830 [Ancylostoma ceylanicum]
MAMRLPRTWETRGATVLRSLESLPRQETMGFLYSEHEIRRKTIKKSLICNYSGDSNVNGTTAPRVFYHRGKRIAIDLH